MADDKLVVNNPEATETSGGAQPSNSSVSIDATSGDITAQKNGSNLVVDLKLPDQTATVRRTTRRSGQGAGAGDLGVNESPASDFFAEGMDEPSGNTAAEILSDDRSTTPPRLNSSEGANRAAGDIARDRQTLPSDPGSPSAFESGTAPLSPYSKKTAANDDQEDTSLLKGDIGQGNEYATSRGISAANDDEEVAGGEPPAISPDEAQTVAEEQSSSRAGQMQGAQNTSAESSESELGAFRPQFGKGWAWMIVKRIPGVGYLFNKIETAGRRSIREAIKVTDRLIRLLKNAERGVAVVDFFSKWLEAFVATLETIIIPILLILVLPLALVFVVIFPKAFSKNAKAMDEFIKKLEAFNKDLKKYYNQSQQVKSINLARAQARANQLDAATSQRPEIQQPRQAA
jgi:hypothetical protein